MVLYSINTKITMNIVNFNTFFTTNKYNCYKKTNTQPRQRPGAYFIFFGFNPPASFPLAHLKHNPNNSVYVS